MSTAATMDAATAFADLGMTLDGPLFSVVADGVRLSPSTMRRDGSRWTKGPVTLALLAEGTADGSRSIRVELSGVAHVEEVCLFDYDLDPAPVEILDYAWFPVDGFEKNTAVFLRGSQGGVFACYANPFGRLEVEGNHVRAYYRPALDVEGTFVSDALVIGTYEMEGRQLKREVVIGRDTVKGEAGGVTTWASERPLSFDAAEVRAVRNAVAARTPWEPEHMLVSHWDWGANLFRLDPADPAARAAYVREAELCVELGVDIFCLAPGFIPGGMKVIEDAIPFMTGPWQCAMWLAMGEDVGHGRWEAGHEPPGLVDLVKGVRKTGVKIAMYINPQYLWLGNPDWKVVRTPPVPSDAKGTPVVGDPVSLSPASTCLGSREGREYLIGRISEFVETYGLSGVSLDFVEWIQCHATNHGHAPGGDSRYAQWDGYRKVLAALRAMGIEWVEGLIGSQTVLPWGSTNMTHPHPYICDNQPQWVGAWPDLSQYRTMGNYQRRVAYWYRNFGFLPTYKVPGQISHQSNRMGYDIPPGGLPPGHGHVASSTKFFPEERGWDWAGARFNILSSIASAPSTISVCFLPGWDGREWIGMRERDGEFFAHWIAFARDHAAVLSRLEDIFDEPRPGAVDGTVAIDESGRGFCFLTNPDFVAHEVNVDRIGSAGLLRELHPRAGRLWRSDYVCVDPHQVAVFEVLDSSDIDLPALFGVAGRLDESAVLVEASGEPGSSAKANIVSPEGEQEILVRFGSDGVTSTLGPWRDSSGEEVEPASLAGSVRVSTTWIPGQALPELLARLRPPILPEGDEILRPWSDPSRLRLMIEIIDPQAAKVRAWINGQETEVRSAYIGTFVNVLDPNLGTVNHLLGYYLELDEELMASEDRSAPWAIELELEGLQEGLFGGVHIAELPARTTDRFNVEIAQPSPR